MRSERGSSRRGPTGTLRSGSMSSRPEGRPIGTPDRPPADPDPSAETEDTTGGDQRAGDRVPDPDDGSASPPPSGSGMAEVASLGRVRPLALAPPTCTGEGQRPSGSGLGWS